MVGNAYTIRQASTALHYSKRQLRQMCIDGRIAGAYKIPGGRKWLIPEEGITSLRSLGTGQDVQTQQGLPPKGVTMLQAYLPSPHKQRILDMAGSLKGEIWLPGLSGSFFYWSKNQQISVVDDLGRVAAVAVDGDGRISVGVSIEGEGEVDDLHAALRSHLETGGFAGVLADIDSWRSGVGRYLEKCRDLLEAATTGVKARAVFRDDVERNQRPGHQKAFFTSACADAVEIAAGDIAGGKPSAPEYGEIARRNYNCQQLTNGLWLLTRYGFGGVCVVKTERQSSTRLREHVELARRLSAEKGAAEVAQLRLDLGRMTVRINRQLQKFLEMEQVPGHCELCAAR